MTEFTLPDLPFAKNALDPVISEHTMEFHYGRHHAAYVANLNALLKNSPLANETLENVVIKSAGNPDMAGVFNNAAQAWNHAFFWSSLKKDGGDAEFESRTLISREIKNAFGSLSGFKEAFKAAAAGQFGSGWAWLVKDGEKLSIRKTGNADTPLAHGVRPILTIDVWEHAYYLDWQNRRADFVQGVMDRLFNWEFAQKRFQNAA